MPISKTGIYKNNGFTLIEIIIVVVLLSIFFTTTIPSLNIQLISDNSKDIYYKIGNKIKKFFTNIYLNNYNGTLTITDNKIIFINNNENYKSLKNSIEIPNAVYLKKIYLDEQTYNINNNDELKLNFSIKNNYKYFKFQFTDNNFANIFLTYDFTENSIKLNKNNEY